MSKAKKKGTVAETRVVKWLHELGFTQAERLALHGKDDISDVRIDPEVPGIIEVKWRSPARSSEGEKPRGAQNHTTSQLNGWLAETCAEAHNYDPSAWGVLCVNEFGKASVTDWRFYVPGNFLEARMTRHHAYDLHTLAAPFDQGAGVYMTSGTGFSQWLYREYAEVVIRRRGVDPFE